ncbi:hypothetical protein BUALT_Bualt02G0145800 [Buddleja alternifolia]|uniref:RING-type domain-containing protein n=1 Tax=Buddleja alternifolia TaxID=168488 RepID=A0AAV6Y0R4_9LAMI|nr:hypothetical protein BUALT_Bualt02G0145800 [Buddleja alternifolia]
MISDSIPSASVAMAASNPKDFAKKKRANRSAKLKQCKLDARREQWLSQVKNKGVCSKEEVNREGSTPGGPMLHLKNERGRPIEKLEIQPRSEEEIYGDGSSTHHYSDSESSLSNSPTSSVLGSNDSGLNFTGSSSSSSSGQSSISSSSINGCCSGNTSEEDEGDAGDDGCLDDWEVMADALAATDNKQKQHSPNSEFCSSLSEKHENAAELGSQLDATNQPFSGIGLLNANPESGGMTKQGGALNRCAWRPDDAYRPQSLPNLSKQYSFPLSSEKHFGQRGPVWGSKNLGPIPTTCPICFEDLDDTDSVFLPCLCGFRLCLFCHKRILEEDGRCPGCRKPYEFDPVEREATLDGGSLTIKLARSCSMMERS